MNDQQMLDVWRVRYLCIAIIAECVTDATKEDARRVLSQIEGLPRQAALRASGESHDEPKLTMSMFATRADYDESLRASGERTGKESLTVAEKDHASYHKAYCASFDKWIADDYTHWIGEKDGAWQAWMWLHDNGLTATPQPPSISEAGVWQDIDTAPAHYSQKIIVRNRHGEFIVAWANSDCWMDDAGNEVGGCTHWRPLNSTTISEAALREALGPSALNQFGDSSWDRVDIIAALRKLGIDVQK